MLILVNRCEDEGHTVKAGNMQSEWPLIRGDVALTHSLPSLLLVYRCEDEGHTVKAGSIQHWVPSFGYVVQENPKPGK